MSDVTIPSYRVQRPKEAAPWRMLAIAGGLVGAAALGGAIAWGLAGKGAGSGAPRDVPLVQAEPRPIKVKPENPGGMAVLNTDQLVLESPVVRRASERQSIGQQRTLAEPEAPAIDALRREAAPPVAPLAASLAPMPAPMPALTPPVPIPNSTPPPGAAVAKPSRAAVQLGALLSEDAARAEWTRLQRRVPELAGRSSQITRFEREGQTYWRLRAGGLADVAAARSLCDQVRGRGGACVPVGG